MITVCVVDVCKNREINRQREWLMKEEGNSEVGELLWNFFILGSCNC